MKPNLFILYFLFFSCSSFAAEENPDFSSFRGVLENHFSSRQENFEPDNTFFKTLNISSNDHSPLKNSQPSIQKVLLDENELPQKSEGVFSFSDSLDVDLGSYLEQFLHSSKDEVSVNIQGRPLLFKPTETVKELFVNSHNSFQKEQEEKIQRGYWQKTVIWKADFAPSTQSSLSGQIEIHIQHPKKNPINFRLMVVCVDKIQRKTKIFFDSYDPVNPLESFPPLPNEGIIFEHQEKSSQKLQNCLRIEKEKIYKTSVSRQTYSLFPDDQTRCQWTLKNEIFIKLSQEGRDKEVTETLPLSYQKWDFENAKIEGPEEDQWLLTSLTDKYFCPLSNTKIQDSSPYIYCSKQGKLSAVQLWKERWKNLTSDLEQDVTYLKKTPYPLAFQENVYYSQSLKEGFYKVSPFKEKEIWEHVSCGDKCKVDASSSKGSLKALPCSDKKLLNDYQKTLKLLEPLKDETFIQNIDRPNTFIWVGAGIVAGLLAYNFKSDLWPYLKEGIKKLPDLSKWANTLSALKK